MDLKLLAATYLRSWWMPLVFYLLTFFLVVILTGALEMIVDPFNKDTDALIAVPAIFIVMGISFLGIGSVFIIPLVGLYQLFKKLWIAGVLNIIFGLVSVLVLYVLAFIT